MPFTQKSFEQLERFIGRLERARELQDVHSAIDQQIKLLGFDYFGYQLITNPMGGRTQLYLTSKPPGWTQRYIEENFIGDDLVTRHAARTIVPFLWHDIAQKRAITSTQQRIFDEAGEFGLSAGGTIPMHGPVAAKALFSLAKQTSEADFSFLFLRQKHLLQILGTYVHSSLLRLGLSQSVEQRTAKLSPRELEVLTWSARGKTTWEISSILGISEATAREYCQNACSKLGTHSKVHAVALAISNGLIVP